MSNNCGCHSHSESHSHDKSYFIIYLVGLAIYLISLIVNPLNIINFPFNNNYILIPVYILSVSLMGIHVIYESIISTVKNTFKKKRFKPNIHLLMSLATIGAFIIGQFHEGVLLIIIFAGAHFLEDLASSKSSESITKLLKLTPPSARLIINDNEVKMVSSDDLKINDLVKVLPGDVIPRDGIIVEGVTEIDEAIITGESLSVYKEVNNEVYGGTLNISGTVIVKINKSSSETILAKIIEMVKESQTSYTKTALLIKKIEPIYVTIVLLISPLFLLLGLYVFKWTFNDSFYRTIVLLIGASPCALAVTDIPATLSALSFLAKNGILFKGGNTLSLVSEINTVAFDKTGTLTLGKPELVELVYDENLSENEIKNYNNIIYSLENKANHPLAKAVINYFNDTIDLKLNVENIIGSGVKTKYKNNEYALLKPNENELRDFLKVKYNEFLNKGVTVVLFLENGICKGLLAFSDLINGKASTMVSYFNTENIETILITGDNDKTAKIVKEKLSINKYYANVLPDEKQLIIKQLQNEGKDVLMVGDGINDAAALKSSNVGISMGDGTDIAIEVSDGVLVKNDLDKLPLIHKVSKKLKRIVKQNIVFSLLVVLLILSFNIFGLVEMPIAVILHEGSTLVVILSGLRMLFKRGL